jgi:nicotinamidase-related amidase
MKKLALFLLPFIGAQLLAAAPISPADVPEPRERSALLMIEFVNEWIGPEAGLDFLMEDREQFAQSREAGKRILEAARREGLTVIHATLRLSDDYREFGDGHFGLRKAIPEAGTWQSSKHGWRFAEGFEPLPGEFVVEGRTGASAFAGGNLESFMRANGITQLFLAGYALHVCVESTLRDAHDRAYDAIVLPEATSAFTAAQREHVLQHVVHHFGAAMDTEAFTQWLETTDQGTSRSATER